MREPLTQKQICDAFNASEASGDTMTDKEELTAYYEGKRSYAAYGMFPAFISYDKDTPQFKAFWDGYHETRTKHIASGQTLTEFRDTEGF